MLSYFIKLTLKKIKSILYNLLQNILMDLESYIPKNIDDIDPTMALIYITLIVPLIAALLYSF